MEEPIPDNPQNSSELQISSDAAGADKSPNPLNKQELEKQVVDALRTVYDPEIPVNIYELGLIYDTMITDTGEVFIKMTLTSPACPVAGSLPPEVEMKVRNVPGVKSANVELVWDPPWNMGMMTEAARLQLNLF